MYSRIDGGGAQTGVLRLWSNSKYSDKDNVVFSTENITFNESVGCCRNGSRSLSPSKKKTIPHIYYKLLPTTTSEINSGAEKWEYVILMEFSLWNAVGAFVIADLVSLSEQIET